MPKVLDISSIMHTDSVACEISNKFREWEIFRSTKVAEWKEIQQYVFATDTTKTNNSKLPWSNKTVIPKLCQIRDNLHANYMAAMFPKRKWMTWESTSREDNALDKRKAIESYMGWACDRNEFYDELSKLVYDYIDYGNCFSTVEWKDRTQTMADGQSKFGYVGPVPRRISPLDIVFNPLAPSFEDAPKIVRSMISLGELKKMLTSNSISEEERQDGETLWQYLNDLRDGVMQFDGDTHVKDEIFSIAGFTSFRDYLSSGTCEVLTFYGDIYDQNTGEFLENHIIQVVDRHKIISKRPNPSYFGKSVIFHSGWRVRPDNLWAMGPLDNIVGMQYRIDHLENMKSDVFDLIAYPVFKIKGQVDDFEWGPFERIIVGDDGDVEIMSPPHQVLQADNQIDRLEQKMEEMAGSPKEAMGFRTPGEKTMYEVQRLELAAGRIFVSKISQFERQQVEEILNAMFELSKRKISPVTIRVFDSQLNIDLFLDIAPEDIIGNGRIRPVAARHFAEKATMVQNLNNFFNSAAARDELVINHMSSIKLAKLWEHLLDIEQYEIVSENIRITEGQDAERLANSAREQTMVESQTSSGIFEGDFDALA